MTAPTRLDLVIPQGKTWSEVLRWGQPVHTFKAFNATGAIVQLAPLQIKITGHGMTDGWSFRLTNVAGMTQLNDRDYVCKKIDADIFEVHELIGEGADAYVRELNAAGYSAYTGGGYLEYALPMDLTGMTMRWQGRKSFDSADPPEFDYSTTLTANGSGIVLDNTAKTVTLQTAFADTALWTFDSLVHEIEATDAAGNKPPFVAGRLTVEREVVR